MPTTPNDAVIRFHMLNYGLLYPAFLGTFIYGLRTPDFASPTSLWPYLFAAYFALHYIEGATDRNRYGLIRGVCDWIEVGLMVALFRAFGYLGVTPSANLEDWSCTNMLAAAIFILPIFGRMARNDGGEEHKIFYKWLGGLSAVAALAVFLSFGWLAFGFTLAVLLFYATGFQFFNAALAQRYPRLKRPPLLEH